ncbi:MAG: nucleotidyl transferase AbiEii/AbiGii toxin family protein [Candidatus Dormibacteria bacterium]
MSTLRREAQLIEEFHLTFLLVLATSFRRGHHVLKGGANLRYFYASFRYSQDLDLDYLGDQPWRLEAVVDTILSGRQLSALLSQSGISAATARKTKQTDTTRRWKLELRSVGGAAVPTKIEISARGNQYEHEYKSIPESVIQPYGLRPFSTEAYTLPAMIQLKVAALAERSQTRARDVFDLDLLLRLRAKTREPVTIRPLEATQAAARARELTDRTFEGEVVPFLELDVAGLYAADDTWRTMRASVAKGLEAIAAASPQQS